MDEIFLQKVIHSLEAEQSVLGSILIDNGECAAQVIPVLKADDFYSDLNRDIYSVICSMFQASKPIDAVTVLDEMKLQGVFNAQTSQSYLVELMSVTPTAANVMRYVDIVRDKALKRKLTETLRDVSDNLESEECSSLISKLQSKLQRAEYLSAAKTSAVAESDYLQDFVNSLAPENRVKPIPTGLPKLDSVLGGGLVEGLYIIAGSTSCGKTSFTGYITDNAASAGHDVLLIELEMTRRELTARSISRITYDLCKPNDRTKARNFGDILRKDCADKQQQELLIRAIQKYETTAAQHKYVTVAEREPLGVDRVWAETQKLISRTGKPPIVVVDYVQQLSAADPKMTDVQKFSHDIRSLKGLSAYFHCPVIAISAKNRASEGKGASLQDLYGSSSLEYAADTLLALQLANLTSTTDEMAARKAPKREMELCILKNRSGKTGEKIPLNYVPAYGIFEEV